MYCKDWNIIILCIPVYLSYNLQLLNVSCFRLLKYLYRTEIEKLIYIYITYISKEDFFPAFYIAFCTTMIESNIRAGFRATGLVLYNPDYIIFKLDIQLCTPMPTLTLPMIWEPKTLHNILKTQSQSIYLKDRIIQHQNSSLTSLLQSIDQVAKGVANAVYKLTLLREENTALRKANDLLSQYRHMKKL